MPRFAFYVLLAWAIFSTACSYESVQAVIGVDEHAPLAVFPSNHYSVSSADTITGLRVKLPENATDDVLFARMPELIGELESLDGFGTSADLWVSFDGPLSAESLPDSQATTDATSPIQLLTAEDGTRVALAPLYLPSTQTLLLRPVRPLAPKTTYILVLGDGLRDFHGRPLRTASRRWGKFDSIRMHLPGGYRPILVSSFTTQSVSDSLASFGLENHSHTTAELPNASPLCDPAMYSSIGWQGLGHINPPDYRVAAQRFPTSFDDRDGTRESRISRVPYRFFLPKNAERTDLVLVQHGLANRKEIALDCHAADMFAEFGFATIAIDAVGHGERSLNGFTPTPLENLHILFGFQPSSQRFIADIRFGRDAMRQTVLDHLYVVSLIRAMNDRIDYTQASGLPGGDGVPDLSGKVFYNGSSMGGMLGGLTVALSPHIASAVLNVPGGRVTSFIEKSEIGFHPLFQSLAHGNLQWQDGDTGRFLALVQTIWERADPINYASHWHRSPLPARNGKNILIQQTVHDRIVPNAATNDLALAGDLPLITPILRSVPELPVVESEPDGVSGNLTNSLTGGMVQFDYVSYEDGKRVRADHGTLTSIEALRQSRHFFGSNRIERP